MKNNQINTHAFFDVDRTIRQGSAALDFCNFLAQKGVITDTFKAKDAKVRKAYKTGKIDYQQMVDGVVNIHGSVLRGLHQGSLSKYYENFISDVGGFFDWTEELFKQLRHKEVTTSLVSAGIYPAIAAIAHHLQTNTLYTSKPEINNGIYTGKVDLVLHDSDKKRLVEKHLDDIGPNSVTIGFGDSTGDVAMLELMDHVFIIDPHQSEMYNIARKKKWHIVKEGDDIIGKVTSLIK